MYCCYTGIDMKKINHLRSRNSFLHISPFHYSDLLRTGSTCLAVASCQNEQKIRLRCPSFSYSLATFDSFLSAEVDVQHLPAVQNNDKVENNMESLAIKFFSFPTRLSATILLQSHSYIPQTLVSLKTREQAA